LPEEISTAGDSFFIVFTKPSDAVKFALRVQARLRELEQDPERSVRDRIGIHVGEVWVAEANELGDRKDLYGIQVDSCARVASLACADQILMTRFAFESARQVLTGGAPAEEGELSWLNHGLYSMKGVDSPVEVFEVGVVGQAAPACAGRFTQRLSLNERWQVAGQ
jgi:class 3 adenylate cyclase